MAVGAAILLLWARALVLQVPNYNYADSFGPTLVELGELRLVPDSAVTWFYGGARTVFPRLIAAACRLFGVTPEFMHTAISAFTAVVGLLGLGVASARIAGSRWAGVLAMIAIPFAWPFALSVGYSAPFWTGYAAAGYWGLGWTCAVWGLWFVSASTGMGAMVPFALAGVEFLAHPTWAIVTLTVLGFGELFEVASSNDRRAVVRGAVLKIGLALLIASPQIAMIVANLRQPVNAEDLAGWWPLIQFRKSFHFYLWEDVVSYARLGLAGLLTTLSITLVWPLLDVTRRRRAVATVCAVAVLVITAYLAIEVMPIRSVSALVLTRSASLLAAVSIVGVAAAAAASLSNRHGRNAVAAIAVWLAFLGVAVPVESAPYASIAQRVSLQMPDVVRAVGNFSLSVMVTITALAIAIGTGRVPAATVRPVLLPVAGVAAAVALTAFKLPLIPPVQAATPTATWNGVTEFLREQTPADSLIVVPPYPYSIASARRSFVMDYSLLGAAVYNPPMTAFELDALRKMYGIDLAGMSHSDIKAYLAQNDGILCLLERKYRELVASEARVRELKRAYPSASYLIGFKPGVTPLEWTCGAYDGSVLDLPIAHENAEYVIYDLRPLGPPVPRADGR